jgi:hypothetical protein
LVRFGVGLNIERVAKSCSARPEVIHCCGKNLETRDILSEPMMSVTNNPGLLLNHCTQTVNETVDDEPNNYRLTMITAPCKS